MCSRAPPLLAGHFIFISQARIVGALEASHSGLVHRLGKAAWGNPS